MDVLSLCHTAYDDSGFGVWDLGMGGLENRTNSCVVCRISLGRPVNIGRDGVQRFPHGAADSRLTQGRMVR